MKRLNPKTGNPFKRGDLDEEQNYFWSYVKNKKLIDGYFFETWISQTAIKNFQENANNGYSKTCTKCGETKRVKDNFFNKYNSPDGYEASCKICFLKKNKRWSDKNKERHSELNASWHQRNKEQHLLNSQQVYEANKSRKLLDYYRREERTRIATPKWVSKSDLLKVYKQAEQISLKTGVPHEVDHIIPLQHKLICGLNVPNNLQVITREMNRKKANKWKDRENRSKKTD